MINTKRVLELLAEQEAREDRAKTIEEQVNAIAQATGRPVFDVWQAMDVARREEFEREGFFFVFKIIGAIVVFPILMVAIAWVII